MLAAGGLFFVWSAGDRTISSPPDSAKRSTAEAAKSTSARPPAAKPAKAASAEPIEAAAVAPPGLSAALEGPAAAAGAVGALARAWSTGSDWARAVSEEGLRVAAPGAKPAVFSTETLRRSRTDPPALPTDECKEGSLAHVGDQFLSAYFSSGRIRPWGSEAEAACFAVGESGPPVRVCVESVTSRVRSVELGRTDRPDDNPGFDVPTWTPIGDSQGETPVDEFYNVVLRKKGEALIARSQPRGDAEIVHRFAPGARGLKGTGRTGEADDWVEVATPSGPGWVERMFVSRARTADQMRADGRYARAVDDAWMAMSAAEAIEMGSRGLYVMHYAAPMRIRSDDWSSAIKESRKMDGAACEACVDGSLQKIVGDLLTDALRDANSEWSYGEIRRGGNRSWLVPEAFAGFNVVSVFDPHDSDCTELEWKTAIFFFDEERGAPRLVGIAFDSWSP